jgi:hypothetical protein
MAIVYDPHQKVPGNLLVGKSQTVVSGRFRLIFPTDGPFFSETVEVFHAGAKLVEGRDFLFSHIYPTSILRTARRIHGAVWIINDKLKGTFTLTAHYLGHGKATPAQITAERQVNNIKIPTKCYWEDVIGVVYFPPVDVQFDRENWKGEQEVMDALGLLAKKMSEEPARPNPFSNNPYFTEESFAPPTFEYAGAGKFISKDDSSFGNTVGAYNAPTVAGRNLLRGKHRVSWSMKSAKIASSVSWSPFSTSLRQDNGPGFYMESTAQGTLEVRLVLPGNMGWRVLHTSPFPKAQFANGITATVDYDTATGVYHLTMNSGATVFCDVLIDLTNPPSDIAADVISSNVKAVMDVGVSALLSCQARLDGEVTFHELPGSGQVALGNVYEMLVHWKKEIDEMFKLSPAIEHVTDKTNPHRDSWGWSRALQLNGIASDTAKIDGRLQSDFAAAINAQLPKLSNLTGVKVPRHALSPVNLSGTFGTKPGVTSVTGSKTTGNEVDVESATTFDPKAAMLLSKGGYKLSYAAPNGLRIKSGTNVLELLPTGNKATWNGKELLTPLTVGPHLPGGTAGGDGLFYGVSTPSVEITGNGIQGVPFLATWVPPAAGQLTNYALRRLTDAFGYSDSLAATPALVKKLDALFTGKLLMSKATINSTYTLAQSVVLDKNAIGLDKVSDLSDENLPISTAQQLELDKYALADHTHDKAAFGIGNATTAKLGLIRFGGLVDDSTLALPGDLVLRMYDRVAALEETVAAAGVDVAVDITRYGPVGSKVLENQVTFTGLMVTVKAQTYYLRKQYPVPVASFNLQELYPLTAQEGTFYIYVDMKDNAAYYFVSDKKVVETDTITEIGEVGTSGGVVTYAQVQAVTRLGDFREFDEHVSSVNDHISYKPTALEMMGQSNPPIVPANGLSPIPDASKWRYDWRFGYDNIAASTTTLAAACVLNRGGANDLPINLLFEYNGFSPDGSKVTWWDTSNMKLQYRIDTAAKRVEIWLLGTFGSTTLPGTYIRSGALPADYLSKPLRIGVYADGNDGSVPIRTVSFVCYSGDTEVLRSSFDETSANRPLNAPGANWHTIFNAAATVNLSMPINPKGKVVVVENSFEALRPVDFKSVKSVVHHPGILGVVRGLADWRLCDVNMAYVPNVNASCFGTTVEFDVNPGNRSGHRILKQTCPIRHDKVRTQRLNFSARATGSDNTVLEIMLGGFVDGKGKQHRFSMLLNNSNYVTNPAGNLVILGFAIDYGQPTQVIIGAPAPTVSGAFTWAQLGSMPVIVNFLPGQVEVQITIKGLIYNVVFAYATDAVSVRFSPGAGNSGFSTITHDLAPYITQLGLTLAELFSPTASLWWGIGGTFDDVAYFVFDHSAGTAPLIGGGDTSLTAFDGYLEHLSAANAVRVYEEAIPDAEVGLSLAEIKTAFIRRKTETDTTGTLFALSPNNVHLSLDLPNKRLQAVVYR